MAVASIISAVWVFVIVYATAIDTSAIQVAQLVTPVMFGVVGWLFAEGWLRSRIEGRERRDVDRH